MALIIIHLSDLHINLEKNAKYISEKSNPFYRACSGIVSRGDTVFLMITGDIADTGNAQEYDFAEKFINGLSNYINTEHESVKFSVYMTPGNHDCDFSKNNTVRQRLMQTISLNEPVVEQDTINIIVEPLQNYEAFSRKFNTCAQNHISEILEAQYEGKRVGILIINSAWFSTIEERSGSLCIPKDSLPEFRRKTYDSIISIQHHPLHWLNPDNHNTIQDYYRSATDLSLFGHEHLQDDETSSGTNWNYRKLRGHEFQNRKGTQEGGFAIYKLSNQIDEISKFEYLWNEKNRLFELVNEEGKQDFTIKREEMRRVFKLKKSTEQLLNDLGVALQHPNKDIVSLEDVYCWPVLEVYNIDQSKERANIRITENIHEYLSSQSLVLIEGGSLYGKTALAKMFYRMQLRNENICIWLDWRSIKKYDIETIKKFFCKTYLDQYESRKDEEYKQLSKQNRSVVIDDFDFMELGEDRRTILFDALNDFFGCIIFMTSSTMVFPYIWREQKHRSLVMLKILPLGNVKRNELICKWYQLEGVRAEAEDLEMERKIGRAREVVDRVLGDGSGLLPALPLNVLGTLQNIENVAALGTEASKFGCIYESLIRKNFEKISANYRELLMEITTHFAYELYKRRRISFSKAETYEVIENYKTEYRVTLETSLVLDNLCIARVLSSDKLENYQFSYSYFYYYFAGKYIAQNIAKAHIMEHIAYMSSHLYVEAYGNIMLFVCHFTYDESVIDEVLINAYCIYDDIEPFAFNQQKEIVDRLNGAVEDHLKIKPVGDEEDVRKHKHDELVRKDGLGINDGRDHVADENSFDESAEKKIVQFLNALKTINVLGQIVFNYPGKITGNMKESIINETHQLGLRTIQMLMETFGFFEKDLVSSYTEYVRSKGKDVLESDIASRVSIMIMSTLAALTQGIIYQIAKLLGNELLYEVVKEILTKDDSISGKLVLSEIELNHLNRRIFQECIDLYKQLKQTKNTFAASILRCSVADYLSNNNCGHDVRDKVCAALNLDKKAVLHLNS